MIEKLIAVLILIALFTGLVFGVFTINEWKCSARWSDFVTEFRIPGGCMVYIDGKFVPQDNVRF